MRRLEAEISQCTDCQAQVSTPIWSTDCATCCWEGPSLLMRGFPSLCRGSLASYYFWDTSQWLTMKFLYTLVPPKDILDFTQFSLHRNWVPCRTEPLNLTCGGLRFRPGQRHVVTGWAVSRICTFAAAGPSHHTSHRWELFDAKYHGILWGFVSASRRYLPFK